MNSPNAPPPAAPDPREVADLKRLAAGIIRAQGNRFIKELLRAKGIRIGVNKQDFERHLKQAIESGQLGLGDADKWLKSVEGWGNQHVYLYNISPKLRRDLTPRKIRQRARQAGLDGVWDGSTVLAFPDEPELTSISFTDSVLRLIWHESAPGWVQFPDKNYTEEEGLDTFEYRAWRKIERRAVTRFEAHVDKGLAGLFITKAIQGDEHQKAVAEARRVIGSLIDLRELERRQWNISLVSRNLDQQNIPGNNAPSPEIKAQKSRLASGGAYVEFAAAARDKAYWEEPAIQDVRKAVRAQQLPAFQGRGGVFVFQPGTTLDRSLRVQLYGKDNRVRLWAQMDVGEVWTILAKLSTYQ